MAPLADGTEENIYYTYDSVDENGNITQGTASLTGPLLTENDKTLSGQYYIVQGNMIIDGNLTVDGSQMGGLGSLRWRNADGQRRFDTQRRQ